MSMKDCKADIKELLSETKLSEASIKKITQELTDAMEVNIKYGGLDNVTSRTQAVDDFIETMKVERIKKQNNKIINARTVLDWHAKIKEKEKPEDYEKAINDLIVGGDHFRDGMTQNADSLMNKTVDSFLTDLKNNKVYEVFDNASVELQDLITREIRLATGSKKDIPTGNKQAKLIGGIVAKHRENARVLNNAYGGNIGKVEGYEGRTRYSESKMSGKKEEYVAFGMEHFDWERIEKTKGKLIDDKEAYISDVFDVVTGEIQRPVDYFGTPRKRVNSSFEKQKSIFFKTGSWELHNRLYGETDVLTNTVEQLLSMSMATGAMRVGGANPSENISNLVKMLNTTSGAKINTRKVNLKMDIVTGAAFAPDSRRIKQTEDIIKNINMFNQLRGAVITAFFGDTLTASMVYKRIGASRLRGVQNSIGGAIKGMTKASRDEINDAVNFMFASDPHHLGSRFEGVDSGGVGGKLMHKYFKLQGLSQITDGSRINHANFLMSRMGKFSKTNWKNLDPSLKKTMETYDIGQKDWDIIREYGVVDNNGIDIITPNTLQRELERGRISKLTERDRVVGKLNNFINDIINTATMNTDARSRATVQFDQTQGTIQSAVANIVMQYKGIVLAFHQKVLRPEFVPPRGEKFNKLNQLKKAGVLLAHSALSGWLILNTKQALHNLFAGDDRDAVNMFDDEGELNLDILLRSIVIGGGSAMYGDVISNLSNPKDFINSMIPASNLIYNPIELVTKTIVGDTENIDREVYDTLKVMTPNLFFTKEIVNSSIIDGLDWIFENNLRSHRDRINDRYYK